ncbi:di-heme oxidoredictase family protein [Singulisphaera sp. Ch08]|uniref:Di-heme oxidoredictase family protein n=1 Tax=Singulisphaera sp. Ch08 TaxID=3120278 RepID=A0AAU7CHM5_9BACT
MRASGAAIRVIVVGLGVWSGLSLVGLPDLAEAGSPGSKPPNVIVELGKQLFERKWIANDPRCHNGDGLGPVFNEASCVACHNLGGVGGAGSNARNVVIVAPITTGRLGIEGTQAEQARRLAEIVKFETGFPVAGSVVLHKAGTRPAYDVWKTWLLAKEFPMFTLRKSERNTPSLFGTGLIDALPDSVLEEVERRQTAIDSEISGRVCRLKDGRIGRFGWKAQIPSLEEFVLTACSVELGLEVPGHHQSIDPSSSLKSKTQGQVAELDLTSGDCVALVSYIRSLPTPVQIEPVSRAVSEKWLEGGALFKSIGCATCHLPTLGNIDGIYSDLLLHDLGPANSDSGAYYSEPIEERSDLVVASAAPADSNLEKGASKPKPVIGAESVEWRTPPLWGLRDTAPYLHNGGAKTLEDAIAQHRGEGSGAAARFARLSGMEQGKIRGFLMSLAAPSPSGPRTDQ